MIFGELLHHTLNRSFPADFEPPGFMLVSLFDKSRR
jgi:hypothetical protein